MSYLSIDRLSTEMDPCDPLHTFITSDLFHHMIRIYARVFAGPLQGLDVLMVSETIDSYPGDPPLFHGTTCV